MREISLTQGRIAIVDDADYETLSQFKWYAHLNRSHWYAVRHGRLSNGKQSSSAVAKAASIACMDDLESQLVVDRLRGLPSHDDAVFLGPESGSDELGLTLHFY